MLVTGSAGYIGSHAALRLLEDGHEVLGLDHYGRGNRGATEVLRSFERFDFIELDLRDHDALVTALRERPVDAVLHFAALAYVGESVTVPLDYYDHNTAGTVSLLRAIAATGVSKFVFSSTCATYGEPDAEHIPIRESTPQQPINPYGRSKWMVERILEDFADSEQAPDDFRFALLRYFNVAGSDPECRVGEDHDPETHLVPVCLDAARGRRNTLTIFGTDYDTPDGTCIRDYVHVVDLVDAHVAVLSALQPGERRAYNVGTGRGFSVREVMAACREVTGVDFPVSEGPRRAGDPPTLYSDPTLIRTELGWEPKRPDLRTMVEDAWRWRETHPEGYRD
ncbi:MAG: UDP-glucose 4-epimerase GalE [Planctomycetota bacterium]